MIPRSSYQVLVFELPRLKGHELEAAARFRVRSLSPLHPEQYRVYLDAFPRGKRMLVVAFLVPGDEPVPSAPVARADFPVRLPKNWPSDVIVSRSGAETQELYVYRGGWLRSAPPPAASPRALENGWTAVKKEHPDLAVEARSFERLPAALFPRFRSSLPNDRSWLVPAAVFLVGLIVLIGGTNLALDRLKERNAQWSAWLKERSVSATQGEGARIEKRWKQLKPVVGVPLREIFARVAARWPSGTKILLFEVKDGRLQIEAESANGLKSVEALLADSWFENLKVVRIRTTEEGMDTFLLDGVVNDS